jgi:hypothetical protein
MINLARYTLVMHGFQPGTGIAKNKTDMPVTLIVFADKSHTNLHGALSLTPIIFMLSLLNCSARNNPKFWRPMGYIPNLIYGKGTSDKTQAKNKIQDKHKCMFICESLKEISNGKGFDCVVLGRTVHVQVWIHFFIGDTEGNNKWLGQYPRNKEGVKRPYQDCKCLFDELSNPNPKMHLPHNGRLSLCHKEKTRR